MKKLMEEKIKKLEETKKKIREKEKRIREVEHREKRKSMSIIGKLAYKANISHLDYDALFGAFLEVAEMAKDSSYISKWVERTKSMEVDKANISSLSISFAKHPSREIREKLKEMKFKWNDFRGEFYGYGSKQEMANLLEGVEHKIEVLN